MNLNISHLLPMWQTWKLRDSTWYHTGDKFYHARIPFLSHATLKRSGCLGTRLTACGLYFQYVGYTGLYLEENSLVLGRDPVAITTLNDTLVVFGAITRLIFCFENGTEAPGSLVRFVPNPLDNVTCSPDTVNYQQNSQPEEFKLIVSMNMIGQERGYFADNNCSDSRRSHKFLIICESYCVHIAVLDEFYCIFNCSCSSIDGRTRWVYTPVFLIIQ